MRPWCGTPRGSKRSEEHTSELQSLRHLVCRLLLEKKKNKSKGAGQWGTPKPARGTGVQRPHSSPTRSVASWLQYLHCSLDASCHLFFFFFNDTATTEIYPLSLHDALPI